MRKRISRAVSVILCVGLLMGSLTSCGKSDEELLKAGIDAINGATSYEMTGSYTGTLSLKEGDATATEVKMDTTLSEVVFQEPLRAKMTSKMEVEASEATEVTSYIQKDGDGYAVYTNTYGTWSKMTLQDSANAMAQAGISTCMLQQLSEDMSRYTKKDDKQEGDKSYLVYEYTFSAEEIQQRITEMLRSWGSNGVTGETQTVVEEVAASFSNLTATLILDRETKSLVRVEYPISDLMTKTIRAMLDAMVSSASGEMVADRAEEGEEVVNLAEALSQITIEAKDMVLVMTYKNLDNATDFEVPKEVLEAESEVK